MKKMMISNLVKLDVNYRVDAEELWENAKSAAERLMSAAGLLGSGSALGFQMNLGADKQCFAFSGKDTVATSEDYNYIFSPFASADDGAPVENKEWGNSYILYYSEKAQSVARVDRCMELLKEMAGIEGSIRVVCFGEAAAMGAIFVELKEKMPLRLRAMIADAFGQIKIEEEGQTSSYKRVKPAHFKLLSAVLLNAYGQLCETCSEGFEDLDDLDDLDDLEDFGFEDSFSGDDEEDDEADESQAKVKLSADTRIEEIDFSVRTFNCLKRNGIYSLGVLYGLSDEELAGVRNLGRKGLAEVKEKLKGIQVDFTASEKKKMDAASDWMEYLDELIGLSDVKLQVKKIAAFARLQKYMQVKKMDAMPLVFNMAFEGNPGTAKTTVARIMADIFANLGILSSYHIVEVGRADIVGKYIGHTAANVKKIFEEARGKVLFIDEAYALVDDNKGSYGDEAINTLVQEMENHRGETIVIMAGYPDKMEEFLSRNPGLKSRVPFRIKFSDYSADEMLQISELEAKRRGFSISPEGREEILDICRELDEQMTEGNGRLCRNLVENAILNYAYRYFGEGKKMAKGSEESEEFVLAGEDFAAYRDCMEVKEKVALGFVG